MSRLSRAKSCATRTNTFRSLSGAALRGIERVSTIISSVVRSGSLGGDNDSGDSACGDVPTMATTALSMAVASPGSGITCPSAVTRTASVERRRRPSPSTTTSGDSPTNTSGAVDARTASRRPVSSSTVIRYEIPSTAPIVRKRSVMSPTSCRRAKAPRVSGLSSSDRPSATSSDISMPWRAVMDVEERIGSRRTQRR